MNEVKAPSKGGEPSTSTPSSSTNAVSKIDSVRWIARVTTDKSTFDVRVGTISELLKRDAG